MFLLLLFQLWTSYRPPDPVVILHGNWQSCPDGDGEYGERVYTYAVRGKTIWNLHLGPSDEFALFAGADEDQLHSSKANLLGPAYHFHDVESRTGRNWHVTDLNLHLNVTQAGGSDPECQSFFVLVEKLDPNRKLAQRR